MTDLEGGAPKSRLELPQPSDRLPLGKELRVSPVCVGMVKSPAAVSAAFDAGINFFFVSADMHWASYEATRTGLEELCSRGPQVRREMVVAVVCYLTQPEFCYRPFKDALACMPWLGELDVAVAGGAYSHEVRNRLPVYRDHRQRCLLGIKAIGASFHDRVGALAAVRDRQVDIAFVRYNPHHPGARWDLFPALGPRDAPLLFTFNSTFRFLTDKQWEALGLPAEVWRPQITDCYRFALMRPEVDGILCSPTTPEQVVALTQALGKGPLTPEEDEHMLSVAQMRARLDRIRAGSL